MCSMVSQSVFRRNEIPKHAKTCMKLETDEYKMVTEGRGCGSPLLCRVQTIYIHREHRMDTRMWREEERKNCCSVGMPQYNFCCCGKSPDQKQLRGGKVYSVFSSGLQSITEEQPRQELKQLVTGIHSEEQREMSTTCLLFACLVA